MSDFLLRHILLTDEFSLTTYPYRCVVECQVFILHHIWNQSIQRLNSMVNLWNLQMFKLILQIYFIFTSKSKNVPRFKSQFSHEAGLVICCPPVLARAHYTVVTSQLKVADVFAVLYFWMLLGVNVQIHLLAFETTSLSEHKQTGYGAVTAHSNNYKSFILQTHTQAEKA